MERGREGGGEGGGEGARERGRGRERGREWEKEMERKRRRDGARARIRRSEETGVDFNTTKFNITLFPKQKICLLYEFFES
jgi:hypothetical protein